MKTFLKNCLLTAALVLCATGTASANQLLVFVKPSDLLAAANFGALCVTTTGRCGIWAVGFSGAAGGTAGQTLAATGGSALISPDSVGTDQWVSTMIAPQSPQCGTAGCSGFAIGGAGVGNLQQEFITLATGTVGRNYNANLGSSTLLGVAPLTATTDIRGIGFLLTFATEVAAGTTSNITFELLGAGLSEAGAQVSGAKSVAGSATIEGLTLVALPEPSSVFMMLGGVFAVSLGAWRKRRQSTRESAI